jgi:hypothetical protein
LGENAGDRGISIHHGDHQVCAACVADASFGSRKADAIKSWNSGKLGRREGREGGWFAHCLKS